MRAATPSEERIAREMRGLDDQYLATFYEDRRERDSLLAKLTAERAECLEQARLNGMGAEREAALLGKIEILRRALEEIASYDKDSSHGEGICPYGCDTPCIARTALSKAGRIA